MKQRTPCLFVGAGISTIARTFSGEGSMPSAVSTCPIKGTSFTRSLVFPVYNAGETSPSSNRDYVLFVLMFEPLP